MQATEIQARLEGEVAALAAHISAATARWLELVLEFRRNGGAAMDGCERWLAWRCGLSTREAREYVRVADALAELPSTRRAFRRGELTFTKVRALTRVATPRSEEALLELVGALTASQLERAVRAYRRMSSEEARNTHELEYVDYYWDEDGALVLRARLAAEDGVVLVRAVEAARERVRERRPADAEESDDGESVQEASSDFEPPRSPNVEALIELAHASLVDSEHERPRERSQIVVHVDAAALAADRPGRSELDEGPVISPETARRLGCDADVVARIEHEGLPVNVGRKRRTVTPNLRRLLQARDDDCCAWPGCENRRHLDAHHRKHWARGGETSLDNLVLLCWHHHRLVHEGGYTIEDAPSGGLRFRNRYGVLVPNVPRSPPACIAEVFEDNERAGLKITESTNRHGYGDPADLALMVDAVAYAVG